MNKEELAALLRANLDAVKILRPPRLRARRRMRMQLRAWQSARFARTYPDLLASERYRPAAEFFLSDLYGPKDFSRRDEELERILPMLGRFLPASGVHTLALGMELDIISETFDIAMARALLAQAPIAQVRHQRGRLRQGVSQPATTAPGARRRSTAHADRRDAGSRYAQAPAQSRDRPDEGAGACGRAGRAA